MIIISRKVWKILGRIWTAPKRILKAFCTHEKTKMHRHECNTRNFLFNLENQTMDFSYTIFPVKKINVGKFLKL
jgi:hypothetical protein